MRAVIVGGGAAGVFSAAAIKRGRPDMEVIMIHDPNTPYIGVGESIANNGPLFFKKYLGVVDEIDLMRKTNSSFKFGIKMCNFRGEGEIDVQTVPYNPSIKSLYRSVWDGLEHERLSIAQKDENTLYDAWLHLKHKGLIDISAQQATSEFYWYCQKSKVPMLFGQSGLPNNLRYSYHINANHIKDAVFNEIAKPLGVKEKQLRVKQVVALNGKRIDHIVLENDEIIYGDIFIDCTGFSRMLVKQIDEFKFSNCDDSFNNAAIVGMHKYAAPSENVNLSELHAMKYGWRFSVPMNDRSGEGYMFNSNEISDVQQLIDEYIAYTGNSDINFRQINWQPGYYNIGVSGNCIPIGISQGFSDAFDANNFSNALLFLGNLVDFLKEDPQLNFAWKEKYNNFVVSATNDVILRHHTAFHLAPRNDTTHWEMMHDFGVQFKTKERLIAEVFNPKRKQPRSLDNPILYFQTAWVNLCEYFNIPVYKDERCVKNFTPTEELLALEYFRFINAKHQLLADVAGNQNDLNERLNFLKV